MDLDSLLRRYSNEELNNLDTLNISNNGIRDISLLRDLTKIKTLNMNNNNISDISVLRYLPKLEFLYISQNNISDISVLKDLKNLKSLFLNVNNISDISVLKNNTKLEKLFIGYNNISDISVLKHLTNLINIYLPGNRISDISSLKNLINLNQIDIGGNDISDISAIRNLTNLKSLNIYDNNISNIPILNLNKLNYLDARNNILPDAYPSNIKDINKYEIINWYNSLYMKFVISNNIIDDNIVTIKGIVGNNHIGSIILEFVSSENGYDHFKDEISEPDYNKLFKNGGFVEIQSIKVFGLYRNKGYAKQLIKEALDYIKKSGEKSIYLTASKIGYDGLDLDNLVSMYKSFGFKIIIDRYDDNKEMLLRIA